MTLGWLRKLVWSWQEGKDRGNATIILRDLTRLRAVIQQVLPASSMPLLGAKVAGNLRAAWEEGKPAQPAHVPQYGLVLYSEQFLRRKVEDFWSRGMKLEEHRNDASSRLEADALRLEAYALYIAAYYLSATNCVHVLPSEEVYQIQRDVKAICHGAPPPFPKW